MSSRTSRRISSNFERTSGLIFFFAIVVLHESVKLSFDPKQDEDDPGQIIGVERWKTRSQQFIVCLRDSRRNWPLQSRLRDAAEPAPA